MSDSKRKLSKHAKAIKKAIANGKQLRTNYGDELYPRDCSHELALELIKQKNEHFVWEK